MTSDIEWQMEIARCRIIGSNPNNTDSAIACINLLKSQYHLYQQLTANDSNVLTLQQTTQSNNEAHFGTQEFFGVVGVFSIIIICWLVAKWLAHRITGID